MTDTTTKDMQVTQLPDTDDAVVIFDTGIPGFGAARRFLLADLTDDGMFQIMTSVEQPDLSLVVASPWVFFPDYVADLPDQDRTELSIDSPDDVALFCSVIVDGEKLSMNLRAPFVTNAVTRQARQVVLDDARLPLRAPLLP